MRSLLAVLDGPVSQRLTWTLLHFLWQGIALAAVLEAVVRGFRVRRAAARYLLCVSAMLAMVACPLVTFSIVRVSTEEVALPEMKGRQTTHADGLLGGLDFRSLEDFGSPTRAGPPSVSTRAEPELVGSFQDVSPDQPPLPGPSGPSGRTLEQYVRMAQPSLLLLWVVGVLLLSLRSVLGLVGMSCLARGRTPVSAGLMGVAAVLARRLGLKRTFGLFGSERVREAIAMGFLRPMVLLPASWLTEMPPEVLEAVIAHELAHVRRLDLWVNLFQRLAEIVLFYHPAVWWLSRRIRLEREMCCDEVAVAATGRRIAYAGALQLAACKRLQAKRAAGALAAAMGGNRMTTLDRVRNILGLSVAHEPMRWWPAGLLAVLVPLLVWFGLVGGPRPAQGENPADGAPSATAPGTAGENTAVEKEKDAISTGAAAQSTPTLNEIHQAWKTRQDRIHSARFEWTETRLIAKRTMPPAGYLERLGTKVPPGSKPGEWLPSDDLTVECSRTVSLNGNMMRVTRQGQYWNPIHARVLTDPYLASFDGEIAITFFAGTGPTGPIYPPVGFITKTDRNGDWNNEGLLPIMLAARPCDIYMGGRDLSNFDENSKMGTIDGHECVILTGWNSAREETLWLDVRRGYIVLRMVRSIGAQHDVTFDISYREDPPHGWLPSGWKQVSAGRPTTERPAGRLMYQVVAKVTKREVNVDIPRSEFQFDFPAGTKVRDRRTEGATKSTEAVPVQPAKSAANAVAKTTSEGSALVPKLRFGTHLAEALLPGGHSFGSDAP